MKAKVNPRSIRIEGRYITTDVAQLARIKQAALEQGESSPVANGLIGWLIDKAVGNPDLASAQTRSNYRKLLARLDESGFDHGSVSLSTALAGAIASVSGLLATAGHPAAAVAAAAGAVAVRYDACGHCGASECLDERPCCDWCTHDDADPMRPAAGAIRYEELVLVGA